METKEQRVYNKVIEFMIKNHINCTETIYQCDWVIENAYEFIADLFEIVEDCLDTEHEEE